MNETPRTLPDSDAELAARIEQATRPAPLTPAERARFAARVQERIERTAPRRAHFLPLAVLGALAAAVAAFVALAPAAPPAELAVADDAAALSATTLDDSWQEQLLYAPEWIERDEGFVDAEVLPESYALASALLEP